MTDGMFELGAILTLYTGRVLAPMDDVYSLGRHLTGDDVQTFQLPRLQETSRPYLMVSFPWLAEIQVPEKFEDSMAVFDFVDRMSYRYGTSLRVEPLPEGAWEHRNPVVDFARVLGEAGRI